MHPENTEAVNRFGLSHGFKVCTSAHYLGIFIWDEDSKRDWLKKRIETWEKNIHTIIETAGKYPQESYAVVVRVIQLEWIFLQQVKPISETRLWEWRICFGKHFCLAFNSEIQKISHPSYEL